MPGADSLPPRPPATAPARHDAPPLTRPRLGSLAAGLPPRPGRPHNLTYEPPGNFSLQVAAGFANAQYTADRASRPGTAPNAGASASATSLRPPPYRAQAPPQPGVARGPPLEVGDSVRVRPTPARRDGQLGRVVHRTRSGGPARYTVQLLGDDGGAEEYGEGQVSRQRSVFSAWFPPPEEGRKPGDNPVISQQMARGLVPDGSNPIFTGRLRAGNEAGEGEKAAKVRWVQEACAAYQETNMRVVAHAFAAAVSGDSGVIFKRKLEGALVKMEALPDDVPPPLGAAGRHGDVIVTARDKALDRLMQIFGRGNRYGDKIPERLLRDDPQVQDVEVVLFSDLLGALNNAVNMAGRARFAQRCFDRYESNGWIHKEQLQEWRRQRWHDRYQQRAEGLNSFQVNVLLRLFNTMVDEETEGYHTKGKKKPPKKGKPPPKPAGFSNAGFASQKGLDIRVSNSLAMNCPRNYKTPRHMDLAKFSDFLSRGREPGDPGPQIVMAFLPIAFELLHQDYYESRAGTGGESLVPRSKLPPLGTAGAQRGVWSALQRKRWSDTHDIAAFITQQDM